MKVVITGGTGFIGQRLARHILQRGSLTGPTGAPSAVDELVLFDHASPKDLAVELGGRVRVSTGDISRRADVDDVIDRDDIAVFHLASVLSGGGEQDFDQAMSVNLEGSRNVLDALRARTGRPRLVFASSLAAFGGAAMPDRVGDTTKQSPQTTYGTTKAICELLVNDYSRKGFLDGRSARLPTVIIRPGAPNSAASKLCQRGISRAPGRPGHGAASRPRDRHAGDWRTSRGRWTHRAA